MADETEEDDVFETKFLVLANELIEHIFNSRILCHKDICHLSRTCHRFNVIANSREVWRVKANQRWTDWKHKPHMESDWKDIFKRRWKCDKELLERINHIINKSYKRDCLENKDLKVFGEYCDDKDDEDLKQIDNILNGIISANRFKMLTLKFYARKIYVYIKQHLLTKRWCKFLCKPEQNQNLIQGAILIAQWCSQLRDVSEETVHRRIDEIALLVNEKVASHERKTENQMGNQDRNCNILESIQQVLFTDIGFHGNKRYYYDVNNSFIDKVLELRTGIPITLSIVFAALAERFGIRLEPVNFPMHFLLKYSADNSSNNFRYVDAFNGGKIMNEHDCIQILPYESRNTVPRNALFPTASPRRVFIRMVANIINAYRSSTNIDGRSIDKLRSALELMMLLCPDDEEHRLMLSRIYLHHGVNLDEVTQNLRQLLSSTRGTMQTGLLKSLLDYAVQKQSETSDTNIVPKYRTDPKNSEVSYYVGMIMHHKRYHYFCVIYGWDNFCHMEESWRIQMGVYNLTDGANQPFYNVLADDGSCRYASQENLVPLNKSTSSGRPISHQDIGKYFEEFDGVRYIPNAVLAKLYPEDGEIPRDFLPTNPYNRMSENEPIDEG